jgi:hypothetical protein
MIKIPKRKSKKVNFLKRRRSVIWKTAIRGLLFENNLSWGHDTALFVNSNPNKIIKGIKR